MHQMRREPRGKTAQRIRHRRADDNEPVALHDARHALQRLGEPRKMLDDIIADDEIEAFGGQLDRLQVTEDCLMRDAVARYLARIDVDERDARDVKPAEPDVGCRSAAGLIDRYRTRAEMRREHLPDVSKGSLALRIAANRRCIG